MKNKKIIVLIIVFIVSIVISFYLGNRFSLSKKTQIPKNSFGQFQMDRNNNMGNRGIRAGNQAGISSGEILSIDDKSITLKLRDGGSRIIFFSNKIDIQKTIEGNVSDLIVGKQINVIGTNNPDGSVNAQSIQIRPAIELKI